MILSSSLPLKLDTKTLNWSDQLELEDDFVEITEDDNYEIGENIITWNLQQMVILTCKESNVLQKVCMDGVHLMQMQEHEMNIVHICKEFNILHIENAPQWQIWAEICMKLTLCKQNKRILAF